MSRSTPPNVDGERLHADLEALAGFSASGGNGITRTTFSQPFQQATQWLMERMREAGLKPRVDAAGNVIGRMGPATGPAVVVGSHIDTVPDGGRFDGTLGVVAGLEAARILGRQGKAPRTALEVIAFSDEEGTYVSLFGSRAMLGKVASHELDKPRGPGGETIAAAMRRIGFDPGRVPDAARSSADFAAYLELHIEQGPVLQDRGLTIGIVDAIVGLDHADVRFWGEPAHAGTTPMGVRRDAFRGAVRFASRAFEAAGELGGEATRLTYGVIEAEPQVTNVVPYAVRLRQEIRDSTDEAIAALRERTRGIAAQVAIEERLECAFDALSYNPPAAMSRRIRKLLGDICDKRQYGWLEMPSGAGHDAQSLAGTCDTALVFVPSANGHSHRPDEYTPAGDVVKGAQVIADAVLRLCN